jgi:hypothetical protein
VYVGTLKAYSFINNSLVTRTTVIRDTPVKNHFFLNDLRLNTVIACTRLYPQNTNSFKYIIITDDSDREYFKVNITFFITKGRRWDIQKSIF